MLPGAGGSIPVRGAAGGSMSNGRFVALASGPTEAGSPSMKAHDARDTGYLSYLLRLWRRRDGSGQVVWCASLEEPGSHHTESFGDPDALFTFLQSRLG